MKFKLITLAFILLIGTYGFSDNIFLSGGFSIQPGTQIAAFNSLDTKIQPALLAGGFFNVNFGPLFSTGLTADYLYALSSETSGGWSYPGFSGIQTGIDMRMRMPFWPPSQSDSEELPDGTDTI